MVSPKPSPVAIVIQIEQLQAIVHRAVADALAAHDAAPTLLTRDGLAKAFACSPGHIDALRKRGLPELRLGDAPRFSLPAVLDWLEQETARG
jgi:hypothetical protein